MAFFFTISNFVSTIGFPAPMLFGYAIDEACLVKDTQCTSTGRCLIYDSTKFRIRLHGLIVIIKVLATICYGLAWFFSRRFNYTEQQDENTETSKKRMADDTS